MRLITTIPLWLWFFFWPFFIAFWVIVGTYYLGILIIRVSILLAQRFHNRQATSTN